MSSLVKCLFNFFGWFGWRTIRSIYDDNNVYGNVVYNEFESEMDVIQSEYKILMIFEIEWTIADTVEYRHKLNIDSKLNTLGLYQMRGSENQYVSLAFRPGFFEFIDTYKMHSDYVIYTTKDANHSIKLARNIEDIVNQQTIPELLDDYDPFKFKMILSSFDVKTESPNRKTFKTIQSVLGDILLEYDLILIVDAHDINYMDIDQYASIFPIAKPHASPYDPFFSAFLINGDIITKDDLVRGIRRIKSIKRKSMILYEIQLPQIIDQHRNNTYL